MVVYLRSHLQVVVVSVASGGLSRDLGPAECSA